MEIETNTQEELKKLDDKIQDAKDNYGDVEVRDAIVDKANYYNKIGDKKNALVTYQKGLDISIGVSKKLELTFTLLHIYVELRDLPKIKDFIQRSKKLLEEGGDWERKNKLKVYEGIYNMMIRDFKASALLFLDSIPTFNCPELISFNELTFYTILTSLISLDRSEIRKKVIQSPDILAVLRDMPELKKFLESFYKCDYKGFFESFLPIISMVDKDPFLKVHKKYFMREMRVVVYAQFLESYKTVTLENMAQAFGISVGFIDKELSEFIAAKKLNCKIDKISGIVESEKIDKRNTLYQTAVKQGDFLLNKLQKLSRIIDI
jgi:26S proteasome regulatory subunit N7